MRKRRNIAFTISVATFLGVCVVSVSAKDLPCGDLRTAKASRLISLHNFTHTAPNPLGKYNVVNAASFAGAISRSN